MSSITKDATKLQVELQTHYENALKLQEKIKLEKDPENLKKLAKALVSHAERGLCLRDKTQKIWSHNRIS